MKKQNKLMPGIVTGAVFVGKYHLCLNTMIHFSPNHHRRLETTLIEGNTDTFYGPWDALVACLERDCFFQGNRYSHTITLVESDVCPDYTYHFVSHYECGVYASLGMPLPVKYKLFPKIDLEHIGLLRAYSVDHSKFHGNSLNLAALEILTDAWLCERNPDINDFWLNINKDIFMKPGAAHAKEVTHA
jgi:hypothetical protein